MDHCVNDFGELTGEAWREVKLFNTYTEISQSGSGLHIIAIGANPGGDNKGHKKGDVEYYTQGRFVALTGHVYTDQKTGQKWEKITRQPAGMLIPFFKHYFSKPEVIVNKALIKAQGKINVSSNDLSDDDIIKICGYAKNSPKFEALWRGDISGYNSPSEADMALVSILTFYSRDPNQLQRLLLSSGLYRDKHNRTDYIARTIEAALSTITETFKAKPAVCYKCKTEYESKESTTCKKCGRKRRY
jgi:putative DNA primase/helicase